MEYLMCFWFVETRTMASQFNCKLHNALVSCLHGPINLRGLQIHYLMCFWFVETRTMAFQFNCKLHNALVSCLHEPINLLISFRLSTSVSPFENLPQVVLLWCFVRLRPGIGFCGEMNNGTDN